MSLYVVEEFTSVSFGIGAWSPAPRTLALLVIWILATIAFAWIAHALGIPGYSRAGPPQRPRRWDAPVSDAPAPLALRAREADVEARLRDLAEQRKRIEAVQALVNGEGDSAALTAVREKMDYAARVLEERKLRYGAQLWVIALVRWQHWFARLTDEVAGAAPGETSRKLAVLAEVRWVGANLLARWEADGATAATREGARCVSHMRELLGRCEQLRQGIVVHEAMLAIRGIAPGDDAERSASLSIVPLESLQTDLGEGGSLTRVLIELDLEHQRLRDDHDTSRDVERFLGELERGQA